MTLRYSDNANQSYLANVIYNRGSLCGGKIIVKDDYQLSFLSKMTQSGLPLIMTTPKLILRLLGRGLVCSLGTGVVPLINVPFTTITPPDPLWAEQSFFSNFAAPLATRLALGVR